MKQCNRNRTQLLDVSRQASIFNRLFWPKARLLICIKYLESLLEMQELKAGWERSRVWLCTGKRVVKLVALKN